MTKQTYSARALLAESSSVAALGIAVAVAVIGVVAEMPTGGVATVITVLGVGGMFLAGYSAVDGISSIIGSCG